MHNTPTNKDGKRSSNTRPIASRVLEDGTIIEMVYDPTLHRTALCVARDGSWTETGELEVEGQKLVPYSSKNNLLLNEVILFPSQPEEYGLEADLVTEIQAFVHRYVQVSPLFEKIAAHYVLFSWVHDGFNELPYLRARGDFGSGKTRFLLIVGALCYKPIFASGASTIAPLFRILDSFGGTLIVDEGDFRYSDEKSELTKILNNGNIRGFPVLRCEVSPTKEINPQAFHVFGPKIMASRGFFDDRALESRFLTEEMGQGALRKDVPINLPREYKQEALTLRNKLLLFRIRNLHKYQIGSDLVDPEIEPRLNQIFAPLLSVVPDSNTRAELQKLARQYSKELAEERGGDAEARVLEIIRELMRLGTKVAVKDITTRFANRHGDECDRKVTGRWIGYIIRKRLGLKTERISGAYFLAPGQELKFRQMCERYGLSSESEEDETASSPRELW